MSYKAKLEDEYYDSRKPGSFGGIRPLARESGVNENDVRNWMTAQDTYTLHKPYTRKFRRRKTVSMGVDDLWQADLVDLTSISRQNDGHKFILTVIDVFSKFAWVRPLTNKSANTVTEAFRSVISLRKPNFLQTDKGTEFLNSTFQRLLEENKIKFYTTENEDIKCAVVERFNRTLKSRMFRYFTHKNTSRYVDVLKDFVTAYNHSYHSTIKTKPADVNNENEKEIREITRRKKLVPR